MYVVPHHEHPSLSWQLNRVKGTRDVADLVEGTTREYQQRLLEKKIQTDKDIAALRIQAPRAPCFIAVFNNNLRS